MDKIHPDVQTLLSALRYFAEGIADGRVTSRSKSPREALIYVLELSIKVREAS